MMSCQCYQCVETPNTRSNLSLVTVYQLFIQRRKKISVGIKIGEIIYEIYSKVTLKIRLLVPAVVRERTLSMWEGGGGGFYKFFKKHFVAQETIDLNISWPSNFFRKYFMTPPINSG